MDLLFVCQFLFLTVALMVLGVLVAVALFASTEQGREDLQRLYMKWVFRRQLKKKFKSDGWGHMIEYAERDVQMVLALHQHFTTPTPTIYDEVALDHGFYPHEDNHTENS